QPHTGIKILRNKFYDNECINLRTNPGDDVTIENNSFGDSYMGISGCGYYAIDVGYANLVARNNVFPGGQEVQETPTVSGLHQTWTGNAGNGFSAGCGSGGASGATMSKNVWTEQKCGSTDKQVSSLMVNSDGSPKAGSPLIDAADSASYPATDILGAVRFAGLAPDAGAFETGATGTTPPSNPTPPADTTPPTTTITSVPPDSTSTSASLSFTSNEAGSTFQCKLDGAAFAACTSPKSYTGLAVGSHTFSVRATDKAGNTDPSLDSASWKVTATSTPPTNPTPPTTTGLVAAYNFNETSGTTVKDLSGHGLNGVRSGATSTTLGKYGRGLSFDGDKDQVTVADNNLLDLTTGMTLEAWVLPSTISGFRTAFAKERGTGLSYGLYASSDTGKPAGDVFTTSGFDTRGTAGLATTRWNHIAATYDGTSLSLYVDGVLASTKKVPGSLTTSTGALRIGGTTSWGEWFKGRMDELRIYNKALTAAQIQTDMKTPIA
ncbi:MAG: hypothetical protein JWQ18_934, partial [Conexibacter sp.]|nr:hypothetical protein [Conexibacter sp.]